MTCENGCWKPEFGETTHSEACRQLTILKQERLELWTEVEALRSQAEKDTRTIAKLEARGWSLQTELTLIQVKLKDCIKTLKLYDETYSCDHGTEAIECLKRIGELK